MAIVYFFIWSAPCSPRLLSFICCCQNKSIWRSVDSCKGASEGNVEVHYEIAHLVEHPKVVQSVSYLFGKNQFIFRQADDSGSCIPINIHKKCRIFVHIWEKAATQRIHDIWCVNVAVFIVNFATFFYVAAYWVAV